MWFLKTIQTLYQTHPKSAHGERNEQNSTELEYANAVNFKWTYFARFVRALFKMHKTMSWVGSSWLTILKFVQIREFHQHFKNSLNLVSKHPQ